jgi:elongator complex protein 2
LWSKDESGNWKQLIGTTGHYGPVEQVAWDPTFTYLMAVSKDRTARVFVPWKQSDSTSWHEIARPQIHGYDLQCMTFIDPYRFASGAEGEKVIRIFDAPQSFVASLRAITGTDHIAFQPHTAQSLDLPAGAAQPTLSLTNKSVSNETAMIDNTMPSRDLENLASSQQAFARLTSSIHEQPPLEEHLLQYTLWPETHKLYGHGYDVFTLAASHDHRLLASASACKAAGRPEDAAVRLWLVGRNGPVKQLGLPLISHTLTITSLQFSWNDQYLVSTGRDRTWTVMQQQQPQDANKEQEQWHVMTRNTKAHSRIIWSVGFAFDDRFFVTGSRDKTCQVWNRVESTWDRVLGDGGMVRFEEGVTCLALLPLPFTVNQNIGPYWMAVGLESGGIQILTTRWEDEERGILRAWTTVWVVPQELAHIGSVKTMAWRVVLGEDQGMDVSDSVYDKISTKWSGRVCHTGTSKKIQLQLATGGADHAVRVLNVPLHQ